MELRGFGFFLKELKTRTHTPLLSLLLCCHAVSVSTGSLSEYVESFVQDAVTYVVLH
jgi:hypothetical protein